MEFDFDAYAEDAPWHVAGNLPYNIGTPLLLRLAQSERGPQRIVAMIQRDVAARLTARPSTPAYGSLTLAVEYTMSVQRAFVLGPQHFYPRPKVDSAVVVLRRRERPAVESRDPQLLLKVVRAAFAYRRKTLANSLTLAMQIDRERTQSALRALALSPESVENNSTSPPSPLSPTLWPADAFGVLPSVLAAAGLVFIVIGADFAAIPLTGANPQLVTSGKLSPQLIEVQALVYVPVMLYALVVVPLLARRSPAALGLRFPPCTTSGTAPSGRSRCSCS